MQGYFKNEKQTKEFMHEDGFMHTGDIGYFDKEGFLYIVDRKKDILKYNNYHVTPSELEDVIRGNRIRNDLEIILLLFYS